MTKEMLLFQLLVTELMFVFVLLLLIVRTRRTESFVIIVNKASTSSSLLQSSSSLLLTSSLKKKIRKTLVTFMYPLKDYWIDESCLVDDDNNNNNNNIPCNDYRNDVDKLLWLSTTTNFNKQIQKQMFRQNEKDRKTQQGSHISQPVQSQQSLISRRCYWNQTIQRMFLLMAGTAIGTHVGTPATATAAAATTSETITSSNQQLQKVETITNIDTTTNANANPNTNTNTNDNRMVTKVYGKQEYTNSIAASRDTNVSPAEAYDIIRQQIPTATELQQYLIQQQQQQITTTDSNNNNINNNLHVVDVGAGAGLSTTILYNELGYKYIDAVDWSAKAWDDSILNQPTTVQFYELDDQSYFTRTTTRQDNYNYYDVIVYNFAINFNKAYTIATTYLRKPIDTNTNTSNNTRIDPKTYRGSILLAPCNDRNDYWSKTNILCIQFIWECIMEINI